MKDRSPARRYLKMLWRFHIRLRLDHGGQTVTPYDPQGRVSPLLVDETQRRSTQLLPYVARYIAAQEAHCAAWEAKQPAIRRTEWVQERLL